MVFDKNKYQRIVILLEKNNYTNLKVLAAKKGTNMTMLIKKQIEKILKKGVDENINGV